MKATEFTTAPAETGRTLQDVVGRRLHISRNKAKALIDSRNVLINDRRVWMARHILRPGDRVHVPQPVGLETVSLSAIRILYQDADYLVADKPAGLLSNGPDSVESRLQRQCGLKCLKAAHRLDKDTTGCLILAKHTEAETLMIQRFADRAITKVYHAVVLGRFDREASTVTQPLDGQDACTRIVRLDVNVAASYLQITLDTGRTHQIRRHLSALGYPVIGDRQYATRRTLEAKETALNRHMLHAIRISLDHPMAHSPLACEAPLPDDFQSCLKRYRLT